MLFVLPARAESKVRYAPPAAWVVVDPLKTLAPTPASEVSYGYDYLLLDTQVAVRDQAAYSHNVYRVTAEGALQSASRVSFDFDPAYEELTIHHLRVIRDGQVEDRLKTTPEKIIQQERDLDRHLLNGELTALFLLEDIRVGDVVDYAYTRRGWNPAFEGHYFSRVATEWAVPVRVQKFRLLAPRDRVPGTMAQGPHARVPSVSIGGGDIELSWSGGTTVPVAEEAETPEWYENYSSIQFSEFKTWDQVVRWAQGLYSLPNPLPASVREQAKKLTQGLATPQAKARALLQFVQQEVRYLGMELGAGSYRPNPPEVVLARRFGDCKDKTMLFCALARAEGILAEPALLNTTYGARISDWLPSPQAFDHVIAVVSMASGEQIWVDPTLTYQQGALAARGLPQYGSALVIRRGNDRLTAINPANFAHSTADYQETIDVAGFEQPAKLHIRVTSTGMRANGVRREFARRTPADLSKSYVNYYASVYPGLTASTPPRISDDQERNIVTVDADYLVPNLWKTSTGGEHWEAEFFPKPILDMATRPSTTVRTTPLEINYPASVSLTTTVNLPKDWTIKPDQRTFGADAFVGGVSISGKGRVVVMKYSWNARTDHVDAAKVAKHMEVLNQFRDALGYTLTYKKPGAAAPVPAAPPPPPVFRLNWMLVLVTLVTLVTALLVVRAVESRKRPVSEPPLLSATDAAPPVIAPPIEPDLAGIGGWLILVAIGVTVTPFRLLVTSFTVHGRFFDQSVWEVLTTPGSESYHAGLGALLLVEIVCNLLLVVAATWQVFLFYRRKRLFPKLYIATLVFSLVLMIGDGWAADQIVKSTAPDNNYKDIYTLLLQAFIWIPYMLTSRRVRQTFTR
jgi:hypothetical protein